jgi:hypothetical protein
VTMPNERTNDARTELRSWYLHSLQPKLARAATTGAVDLQAVAALDAEVRSFLDLHRARMTVAPRKRSWPKANTTDSNRR